MYPHQICIFCEFTTKEKVQTCAQAFYCRGLFIVALNISKTIYSRNVRYVTYYLWHIYEI